MTYANYSLFDDTSCSAQGSQNIIANPLLSLLTNNGGNTLTLLPQSNSPAIDAANNLLCPDVDQRNLPRPVDQLGHGAICDIGAVELQ